MALHCALHGYAGVDPLSLFRLDPDLFRLLRTHRDVELDNWHDCAQSEPHHRRDQHMHLGRGPYPVRCLTSWQDENMQYREYKAARWYA